MAQSNLTIRIDTDLKREAKSLFSDIGLNMSSAINIFIRQALRERAIPFALKPYEETGHTPNAETLAFFQRVESGDEEIFGPFTYDFFLHVKHLFCLQVIFVFKKTSQNYYPFSHLHGNGQVFHALPQNALLIYQHRVPAVRHEGRGMAQNLAESHYVKIAFHGPHRKGMPQCLEIRRPDDARLLQKLLEAVLQAPGLYKAAAV